VHKKLGEKDMSLMTYFGLYVEINTEYILWTKY